MSVDVRLLLQKCTRFPQLILSPDMHHIFGIPERVQMHLIDSPPIQASEDEVIKEIKMIHLLLLLIAWLEMEKLGSMRWYPTQTKCVQELKDGRAVCLQRKY